MKTGYKRVLLGTLIGTTALMLSGCFLQLLVGRVFVRTIGEEVQEIIAAVFGNSTTAICTEEEFDNEDGQAVTDVECTYVIASENSSVPEVTSTAELISEFGILGVFLDPVILQVPQDAMNFVGTFTAGSGPAAIVITEVPSFYADATTEVLPESGQKFVILEFPAAPPNGTPLSFNLEFKLSSLAAVNVKPMFAGKVEVNGNTFYPPLLPCTTDFSSIPAVTIPVSQSANVDLSNQLINALLQGTVAACDGQVYNYISTQPSNEPPDCWGAAPSVESLWPPNHTFVPVQILGVTDPDGDPVLITIDAIDQDEPTDGVGDGNTCPDAHGIGTDMADVRAERSGRGDGRVYHIEFTAEDDMGAACTGSVTVCVPHDQGKNSQCADGWPLFDSTLCE